jgi:hypothetical protein
MSNLRVAVVTSNPRGNAARITHHLVRSVPSIEVAGALVDTGSGRDRARQRQRLRAWHRHGGTAYLAWRLWLYVRPKLIRESHPPAYRHSIHDLGRIFGFSVTDVPSINSASAQAALRALDVDLGVSISNRVIDRDVFSIPRLGMINLHHGRIPEYRGGPPAFWELYNGEPTMGVSVHRIDAQLDHGQLLARTEIPILPGDDPKKLIERARSVDYRLVAETLDAIARGSQCEIPVDFSGSRVSTLPSWRQVRELRARLGHPIGHDDYLRAELHEVPEGLGNEPAECAG